MYKVKKRRGELDELEEEGEEEKEAGLKSYPDPSQASRIP